MIRISIINEHFRIFKGRPSGVYGSSNGYTIVFLFLISALFQAGCVNTMREESEQDGIFRAGERVQAAGDSASAIKVYKSALEKNPPHKLPIYLKLGQAYTNVGEMDNAKKTYVEALPYDENNQVKHQLGRLYISAGKPENAMAVFEKVLAVKKDDLTSLNGMGVAHDLQGQHPLAQGYYAKALLLDEENDDVKSNMGLSLAFEGRYEEALEVLRPIGERLTATSRQRHNLALVYALAGDPSRARDLFGKDMPASESDENIHLLRMAARPPVPAPVPPNPAGNGPE